VNAAESPKPAVVEVEFPWRLLSPNAALRLHWAAKARRRATERSMTETRLLATGKWIGLYLLVEGHGHVVITLTRLSPRAFDSDNLQGACKSIRDGVADWLGLDDADPRLRWEYRQEKAKMHAVRIRIEVMP
jgi:hypothetical protein